MKKINRIRLYSFAIIGLFIILTNSCKNDEENTIPKTVKDIDGNVYHTVTIGTQVWMVENLNVTHFRNGDSIPNITDYISWGNITTSAYCYFDNKPSNGVIYGKLYNWYSIHDSCNICPEGWHIPSDAEWTILTTYLGGETVAGGKLKEKDTIHWLSPNTGANNITGFTALPGSTRFDNGSFFFLGMYGCWWSSTEIDSQNAYYRYINNSGTYVGKMDKSKNYGYSVRCIKD